MHITVTCPRCQSHYQVEPDLRGKRMRCPNAMCRAVFEVRDDAAPPPVAPSEPAPAEPGSGSVGDMVPVLPAEMVKPPEPLKPSVKPVAPAAPERPSIKPVPPPAPERPSWQQAPPPPRRLAAASAQVSAPAGELLDEFPVDDPASVPEAPRSPSSEAARATMIMPATIPAAPASLGAGPASPHQARRRSLTLILSMLGFLAIGAGVGLWWIAARRAALENERFQEALAFYDKQEFGEAFARLQQLQRDYPGSDEGPSYRFLAELSDVRQAVIAPHEDTAELLRTLQRMLEFLAMHQNDPLLQERHTDVWNALYRLATDLTAEAERVGDKAYLALAQRAWTDAKKYQAPAGVSVAEIEKKLHEDSRRIDTALARQQERRRLDELLATWTAQSSAAKIRQARRLVEAAKLQDEPAFQKRLAELVQAHREQIAYSTIEKTPPLPPDDDADALNIAVTPLVGKAEAAPVPPGVVLALARGVLYALDAQTGAFRWARRVGVDMTELPLRTPAGNSLDRVFVVAAHNQTLSAVDAASGAVVWRHPLGDVALARPLHVEGRLLMPTLGGRIEEIDSGTGQMLGYWQLDQALPYDGTRLAGSSLVYFTGESDCIYALDLATRQCAGILYTGHAAGELAAPPVVWHEEPLDAPAKETQPRGWLALPQTNEAGTTQIRVWTLPWDGPDQAALEPVPPVAGRSWSSPWLGNGKLALVTDAGQLGLFGIRLPGNRDPLLFPWSKGVMPLAAGAPRGRAVMAHAEVGDYWLAAQGKLQRVQESFSEKEGRGLLARWPDPPALGSPLHSAQALAGPDDKLTLYLATQPVDGAACLFSAVDAHTGRTIWQRQLGIVPRRDPIAHGGRIILPDANGLLAVSLADVQGKAGWQASGDWLVHDAKAQQSIVSPRDKNLVRLAWHEQSLQRQHYSFSGEPKATAAAETNTSSTVTLPASPAGPPALDGDYAVFALTNGVAARVPLQDGPASSGPDWRASGAEEAASAHVVALGADLFALTDGSRGLQLVHWPSAKEWQKKASASLAHRIVASPAVLPGGQGSKLRLAVADASDTVTLLEGDGLQPARRWPLGGKITHGPIAVSGAIVVVLERRRVVWLEHGAAEPRWQYACAADLAGAPRFAAGRLLLADVSGAITVLDTQTGEADAAFMVHGNVAPAAAPLALDDGRLALSLSDGTLVLLPAALSQR